MSWTDELYKVYEQQCGNISSSESVLVPLFHEIKIAQIEITIKEDGSFINAELLTPEEGVNTIFPCSKIRTSNIAAYALADELIYICGDYSKYVQTKIKSENDNSENIVDVDNSIYFSSFEMGLKNWMNSNYTHPAVSAVYKYISKKTVLTDLIDSHLFTLDSNYKILDSTKISTSKNTILKKAFVRFKIIYKDFNKESKTWLDSELFNSFELYSCSLPHSKQLCYASGEEVECTYSHAMLGLPVFPQAKIISSNDKNNFTFRGRFSDAEEAISVGKIYSDKIHKALKWLMTSGYSLKLGEAFNTSDAKRSPLMLIVWANDFEPIPSIWDETINDNNDPYDESGFEPDDFPTYEPIYREYLKKRIWGNKAFDITSRVILMSLEATNKGRASIGLYTELNKSDFLNNLNLWHSETSALRFYAKQRTNGINSFAVREIINCAYGIENGSGFLETKPEIIKENVLRLLPCITQGRALPADIVQNLVKKASNPLAYEHGYNHRKVIETACGMIRKQNFDRKRGIISMAYDPNEKDRSYLFGCLLAIADAAEYAAYDENDKKSRITNAKRYWSMFAKRPATTWQRIYEQLTHYLKKLGASSIKYTKMLNEVKSKLTFEDSVNNSPLSPAYLLGYHHYNAEIYKNSKKTEEE